MAVAKKTNDALRADTIKEFKAKVNKKFGANTLISGSEIARSEWPRATTGSLAFDVALGGGWPLNQWNEVIGLESSGKTATILKTIAANQALNPDYQVLWVAAEDWVDDWARKLGVDPDRMVILEDNVMESVLEVVDKAIDNQLFDAVIIDSLPALVPGEEAEKAMDEFSTAVGARLLGKFFRKANKSKRRDLVNPEGERDVLCIIVNQWRDKIGVMFGDPRTTPGGKAKNFAFFTRVEVARDEWLVIPNTVDPNKPVKVGQAIKVRTMKNKTAPPQRTATIDFYFSDEADGFVAGEYDAVKEIINLAVSLDVIQRPTKVTYSYGGEVITTGGKPGLISTIRNDDNLQKQITGDVLMLTTRNGEASE
jgi:recombination protein RecA